MAARLRECSAAALALPPRHRARLARVLISSLDADEAAASGVRAAWHREIARRVREIDEGRAKGRPASDVIRDLRARLT